MYDQEFRLYNLQPIHLPLPNQENQWMVAIHTPYIAVNIDSGTYVTLNENWYENLECQGRNNVYCKSILTEHLIGNITHTNTLLSRRKSMTLNNIVNLQSWKKNNYRRDDIQEKNCDSRKIGRT